MGVHEKARVRVVDIREVNIPVHIAFTQSRLSHNSVLLCDQAIYCRVCVIFQLFPEV